MPFAEGSACDCYVHLVYYNIKLWNEHLKKKIHNHMSTKNCTRFEIDQCVQ